MSIVGEGAPNILLKLWKEFESIFVPLLVPEETQLKEG
jgi:hypothetical protein